MPTREQIEQAMKTHFEAYNARDRARWIANFADDIVLEDPVGGPIKTGTQALALSWENSFKEGHSWTLEPLLVQIVQNHAACHVRNHGSIDGAPLELDSIEIYTINDAGRISYIQTYFTPPEGRTLDPYFMQAHAG